MDTPPNIDERVNQLAYSIGELGRALAHVGNQLESLAHLQGAEWDYASNQWVPLKPKPAILIPQPDGRILRKEV